MLRYPSFASSRRGGETRGRGLRVSTGCGADADVSHPALGKKTSETVCVRARVRLRASVEAAARTCCKRLLITHRISLRHRCCNYMWRGTLKTLSAMPYRQSLIRCIVNGAIFGRCMLTGWILFFMSNNFGNYLIFMFFPPICLTIQSELAVLLFHRALFNNTTTSWIAITGVWRAVWRTRWAASKKIIAKQKCLDVFIFLLVMQILHSIRGVAYVKGYESILVIISHFRVFIIGLFEGNGEEQWWIREMRLWISHLTAMLAFLRPCSSWERRSSPAALDSKRYINILILF